MTRLTNALREEVAGKIIKKTFEKRFARTEKAEARMALKIRNAWLGPHKRAYLKMPPDLQVTKNGMQINLNRNGQSYDRFDFGFAPKIGFAIYGVLPASLKISKHSTKQEPVGGDRWTMLGKEKFDAELWTEIVAHVDLYEELISDVQKLHRKIMDQLRNCTTVKKLNDLWPEAVTYVPAQDNPIAVIVDREGVNKMISCMKEGDCGQTG